MDACVHKWKNNIASLEKPRDDYGLRALPRDGGVIFYRGLSAVQLLKRRIAAALHWKQI